MPSYFDIIPDKLGAAGTEHNKPEKGWKQKVYAVIFESHTPAGKLFDVCLFLLILSNILFLMLESVAELSAKYYLWFRFFDFFYMVVFTLEYILRLICVKSPKKYATSVYGIIDFFAIFPSYLELFLPNTHMLMVIRSFRLLRVFRIFRMVKFLDESRMLVLALLRSFRKIVIFLFFVLLLTVFMGSFMYVLEFDHNSGFSNIPQSIYWAIVTITTVGYGDIAPSTPAGKIMASFIMILGYAIIAVPTGIITANALKRRDEDDSEIKKTEFTCPACHKGGHTKNASYCKHCGQKIADG